MKLIFTSSWALLPESKTYKIKVKELLANDSNDSYKNNNKNKKKIFGVSQLTRNFQIKVKESIINDS